MASRTGDEGKVSERVYSRDSRGRFASAKRPGRTDTGTGTRDASRRPPPVGLTKDSIGGTIGSGLNEFQLEVSEELLSPLREGKAVWLLVKDKRLPKKTRKYETVLVLAPTVSLGGAGGWMLVSMPPYGSELIDTRTDLKATTFARLGLSFSLASALVDALCKTLRRK